MIVLQYCRRKFRSQTSDNMDRWKAEQGRGRKKRKIRRKKSRRERVRRKKMQMREKVGKSRNIAFFHWFGGSGGSKSRLAKAAGAEPAGQMRDEKLHAVVARSTFASQNVQNTAFSAHFLKFRCRKKCTPLWREARLEVKMYKAYHVRTTFGSCDVKKVHAVVARSTFPSQNAQNTPCSDHFLEVEMSKKCTPLWREAHFEVKMLKTPGVRTTFGGSDVEKVHAVVARSTFRSQNVKNTRGSDHFWRFRCRFASVHYNTLHYTTLHSTTLHYTPLH